MSLEINRQNEWTPVDPPVFSEERKIHRGNATRSAQRLLHGLNSLGLQLTKPYKIAGMDLPRHENTSGQIQIVVSLSTLEVPRPNLFIHDNTDIVQDFTPEVTSNSYYSIEAHMVSNNQSFRMLMNVSPKDNEPYKLNLIMPTSFRSSKEILLESLPHNFTSVGFAYDLTRNPQHKDRLSALSKKRVPAEIIDNNIMRRSSIRGHETEEGINTQIHLYLQNPNVQNFLKCYEVELFSKEGLKNPKNTTEVAPEAIWQAKENHYCMVEGKSYPLIPIDLDKTSKLAMVINYRGDTPQIIFDLIGNLPLSIDGTNQWYATGFLEDGNVELLFKPEWGENNTALVYRQKAKERISPKEIHSAVVGLSTLKKSLTERLAA